MELLMNPFKRILIVYLTVWLLAAVLLAPGAQAEPRLQADAETREIMALTYQEGRTVSIKLQGTWRLPKANGEAKVERKKGATEIEIELDEMKPARLFGGDFNTYILWTVSPQGYVTNVGEFVLEGNRSKLNVTTPLQAFGMFVTAEPHFLVRAPSRLVVLENTRAVQNLRRPIQTSQIRYRGHEGSYELERQSLDTAPEARREVRTELHQARTALALAERAQAEQYALAEFTEARLALRKTEEATRGGVDKRELTRLGKEAVRLAYQAQHQAEETKAAEQRRAEEAEKARLASEAAAASRRAAEEAAKREEAARQAEEAALRAEESARQAAEQAARREEAARRAEAAAQRAAEEAVLRQQAEAAAARAGAEAERATREREEARARMQRALGLVAETRESARGIIVNLPDILFDFNKATLRPQAREVISRIVGILMVTPGFRLGVEGHTDSVGSHEYNQGLSEKRAQAVKDYLVSAGIALDLITTQGFGKARPIADNSTPDGRQKNRRVEIVIEDAAVPE